MLKCAVLMLINRNLPEKNSEVSIKTRSTSASLSFKGQPTKHTTVKWSISDLQIGVRGCLRLQVLSSEHEHFENFRPPNLQRVLSRENIKKINNMKHHRQNKINITSSSNNIKWLPLKQFSVFIHFGKNVLLFGNKFQYKNGCKTTIMKEGGS